MPEFETPADIGNRALQRVGAQLLGSSGFAEASNRAVQVSFCYGKLRRAELQRNVWTFATRKAALRAVDSNTMLLTPTLWSSTVTYFVGSVVEDQSGTLWKSTQRNNLGNDPSLLTAWVPYFGPMTAEPFDSSKAYFTGEIIYNLTGAGTYNVYESLVDGNALHPAMPNLWALDTIYKTDDVVVVWPAWSSGTTYSQGQTVQYTDGLIYSSLTNGNTNNIPPSSGTNWAAMPTLTLTSQLMPTSIFTAPPQSLSTPIDEWQPATAYSSGAFVLYNGSVYLSIAANNTNNYPNASGSTFWAAASGGTSYQSLIDLNQGNNPANAPALWAVGTTYAINALVGGSDGFIYKSLANGNIGHNPVTDSGVHWQNTGVYNPWTTVFTLGGGNSQWIQIGGNGFPNGVGISALQITYPIGCGPAWQTWSKNVYRLPAGYLRKAPQDPKAGINSWLGVPGNLQSTDWAYEGDFITTWESRAIVVRFVADVQDVTKFWDVFCEALSCRIALEICEPLTQSTAKLQVIGQEYKKFMTEAIQINAIELGPVTPPLDDLIACRV